MMFAVGPYSGPRAVFGAVAQLVKNAKHVTAPIRRMDTLAFSTLIDVGRDQTVGDDSKKCSARSKFSYKTLGLRLYGRERQGVALGAAVNVNEQIVHDCSGFVLE